MRAGNPIHDLGLRQGDAERHTTGDTFRDGDDVGLDAAVLDGPPLAGASAACLHFVADQQNAVRVADAPQLLHELRRSRNVSAFTLLRFHNDGRNFFRRQRGLEQPVFDVARAIDRVLLRVGPGRAAIDIWEGNVAYA